MSIDRKVLVARLAALEKSNGTAEARALWQSAKAKTDPLHDAFEWDNNVCGDLYRDEQARRLIRSVTIEVINETRVISAPAYVRDPSRPADEQGYKSITALRKDEDLSREVLVAEFKRAIACMERARTVAEALDLGNAVDDIVKQIDAMKRRLDPPSATQ